MSILSRKRKWSFKRKRYATSFKSSTQRAWAKLLAILFDYGYIYLIKSNSKNGRYKIGISYDMQKRAQQIDQSIPGSSEYPVFHVRMFFSEYYEKKLHARFKKHNFTFIGSGKTEWHKLNSRQLSRVCGWMKIYKAKQDAIILISAVLLLLVASVLKNMSYEF